MKALRESLTVAYRTLLPLEQRRSIFRLLNREHFHRLRTAVYPSPKGTFSLRGCDRQRAIFIHTPKAAGTSIALAIFGELPYHYSAADYIAIFGRETFEQYFKFSFVRNPWDRVYSAFQFLRKGGWDDKDKAWAHTHLSEFADFDDFVRRGLARRSVLEFMHFRTQRSFVCDWQGRLLVDYLGYFETIDADFRAICARVGVEASLPHTNRSTEADYRVHYSDETRAIVGRVYAQDARTFGYDFNGIVRRATPT